MIRSMTTLNITLSDELKGLLEARAAECGFDHVEDYVQSLLKADARPAELIDEDLEELLLKRLDNPELVELTPTFVEQFKQQVAQRRKSHGAAQ
jgi:hypothetical protein